jgi:nucleotide-binding universal stress UspA family protein
LTCLNVQDRARREDQPSSIEEPIMYSSIIVAVDVSQIDRGATILAKAAGLVVPGGRITLVNVVEEVPGYLTIEIPDNLVETARADCDARLRALRDQAGVSAGIEIRNGPPAREILSAAEANHADLIIIASHKPDLSNYFIGATADRVVRHAKCSVLVDR